MKIAINKQFGGFRLSHKAMMRMFELKGIKVYPYFSEMLKFNKVPDDYKSKLFDPGIFYLKNDLGQSIKKDLVDWEIVIVDEDIFGDDYYETRKNRLDKHLIQAVEELGEEANLATSDIKIVEIPDGYKFSIRDYDGLETLIAGPEILEF